MNKGDVVTQTNTLTTALLSYPVSELDKEDLSSFFLQNTQDITITTANMTTAIPPSTEPRMMISVEIYHT